jgi:D-lactate dehydrogenase
LVDLRVTSCKPTVLIRRLLHAVENDVALLTAKPGALRPTGTEGLAADRVVEDRAAGTPDALRDDLIRLLGDSKVLHTISDLVRYASDASPYRFVPQVVVIAETEDDVAQCSGTPVNTTARSCSARLARR